MSVLFTVLFSMAISAEEADGALSSDTVLPAGTVMVVPQLIVEEFEADHRGWKKLCPHLSRFYSLAGPSLSDGFSTYYYPLSRADGKKMDKTNDIWVVDIMNLEQVDEEKCIFKTRRDTSYDDLDALYDYFYRAGN